MRGKRVLVGLLALIVVIAGATLVWESVRDEVEDPAASKREMLVNRMQAVDEHATGLEPLADRVRETGEGGEALAAGLDESTARFHDLRREVQAARGPADDPSQEAFWDKFEEVIELRIQANSLFASAIRTGDRAKADRVTEIRQREIQARDELNELSQELQSFSDPHQTAGLRLAPLHPPASQATRGSTSAA